MKKTATLMLAASLIVSLSLPAYTDEIFANNGGNGSNNSSTASDNGISKIYFTVEADQTIDMTNNRQKSVNVKIKNSSKVKAKNVTAQAIIENPQNAYISGSGIILSGRSIGHGESASGSFTIETSEDFQSQTIPVKIVIKYYNGTQYETQEETVYIRATAESPSIEIKKVDRMWPDKVQAGQPFPAVFEITNTGGVSAKNIKLSIEGLENNGLTLADGLSTKDITNLNPKESQYVYFNLKSQNSTKAGSYMLKLNYAFNAKDEKSKPDGSYSFTVDIYKTRNTESVLEFSNVTFPGGIVGRDKVVNISFDVTNTGKLTAQDITVSAISQDVSGLTSKSVSSINAKPLKPGEKASFSFQFITTPSAETRNYPVDLKVTYTDNKSSEEPKTISQVAGVFVKAPKEPAPGEKKETSVPKLIIDDYSFEPEIIEAGKPFKLRLRLYNTSSNKTVKNIKIFLSSDVQETVNKDGGNGDSGNSGGTPGTASVFTPVNSSNTFYIASIAPNAKVEKEIELTTVPDTAAKTYTVVANFEYEDSQAQKFTSSEQIGIPVVQKAKLTVGEIVPDGIFSPGAETPLSVDFYNTGKATLYNVMVKASGDGLKFDTPSYYKGNFAPGSSDNFSCNITPETPGKKTLTLTFSFEDSTGQQQSVIRDYTFDVEDMAPATDEGDNMPSERKSPLKIIIIVLLIVVAAAAGVFIYRKRKQKKNDDNDLEI